MEGGKTHTLYYENIRAFGLVIINATLFPFVLDYEVAFISAILWAGCNKIKSNIVNCRMYFVARKQEGENKNTK